MGIDWEGILDAEGDDIQDAWEENVERNDYYEEDYDYDYSYDYDENQEDYEEQSLQNNNVFESDFDESVATNSDDFEIDFNVIDRDAENDNNIINPFND